MRNATDLSAALQQLERGIESLRSKKGGNLEDAWFILHGELAKTKYELFCVYELSEPEIAVQLLDSSIRMGFSKAQNRLQSLKSQEASNCISTAELEKLDRSTVYLYGLKALTGIGAICNHSLAFNCFEVLAKQGDSASQFLLAHMYRTGLGVQENRAFSVNWIKEAALREHALAQNQLGWAYKNGDGIEQSDALAVHWYQKAALNGSSAAKNNLGWMYKQGRGVPQDDALTLYWFRLASLQGCSTAHCFLGEFYRLGQGLEQDNTFALYWFRQGARQGHQISQSFLLHMYKYNLIKLDSNEASEYRIDVQKGSVSLELVSRYLNQHTDFEDISRKYHRVMLKVQAKKKIEYVESRNSKFFEYKKLGSLSVEEEPIVQVFSLHPNEFFEHLMKDSLLDEETRFFWILQLFNEHCCGKKFWYSFAGLPKLKPAYVAAVNIEVAIEQYAHLSQLGKGRNVGLLNDTKTVDLNQIKEEKIAFILNILKEVSEKHSRYAEVQLIMAHLHYMQDKKGPQWKKHFNTCMETDLEKKWIDMESVPKRAYEHSVQVLKSYRIADLRVNSEDVKQDLLQSEIKCYRENNPSIQALLRLSIMTEDREKRGNYLLSAKALNTNPAETKSWLKSLDQDLAISEEVRKEIESELEKPHATKRY